MSASLKAEDCTTPESLNECATGIFACVFAMDHDAPIRSEIFGYFSRPKTKTPAGKRRIA